MDTQRRNSEESEMINFFRWARGNLWRWGRVALHVANEGDRDVATSATARLAGLVPGMPDILIPGTTPDGRFLGVAIEMKRQHGGHVGARQWRWLLHFAAIGWFAFAARGCADALATLARVGYAPARETLAAAWPGGGRAIPDPKNAPRGGFAEVPSGSRERGGGHRPSRDRLLSTEGAKDWQNSISGADPPRMRSRKGRVN